MKYSIFLITTILICLSGLKVTGQDIATLEQEVKQATGQELFQKLLTLSDLYYSSGDYPKASQTAEKAVKAAEPLQNFQYTAQALNRQGKALFKQGSKYRTTTATVLEKSLRLAEVKGDKQLQLANLELLAVLAVERGRTKDAQKYTQRIAALGGQAPAGTGAESATPLTPSVNEELKQVQTQLDQLSKQLNVQKQERDSLSKERKSLTEIVSIQQKAIQNMSAEQAKAQLTLELQKRLVDSLSFEKELDSMQLANNFVILKQKQDELKLKNTQRNLFLALAALIFLLTTALYNRYRNIKTHSQILEEKNKIILEERQRSENLLLNILPATIAEELKRKGRAEARRFEHVTVMLSDFKNFTHIAEALSPEELVHELDYCFRAFDKIVEKYGLEKIKTIGDAYMCVGGLPDPSPEHAVKVVAAAREMLQFLEDYKVRRQKQNQPFFEARVGIHSGPLVAGVVGDKKFAYDIWGDTVNVASRMETGSEPGHINISESTYQLVKKQYNCTHRGKVMVKNKGEVDMYFVEN